MFSMTPNDKWSIYHYKISNCMISLFIMPDNIRGQNCFPCFALLRYTFMKSCSNTGLSMQTGMKVYIRNTTHQSEEVQYKVGSSSKRQEPKNTKFSKAFKIDTILYDYKQ